MITKYLMADASKLYYETIIISFAMTPVKQLDQYWSTAKYRRLMPFRCSVALKMH